MYNFRFHQGIFLDQSTKTFPQYTPVPRVSVQPFSPHSFNLPKENTQALQITSDTIFSIIFSMLCSLLLTYLFMTIAFIPFFHYFDRSIQSPRHRIEHYNSVPFSIFSSVVGKHEDVKRTVLIHPYIASPEIYQTGFLIMVS